MSLCYIQCNSCLGQSGLMIIKLLSTSLYLHLEKKPTANQNTVSNKYFVLIGQFCSTSTKIILESFMIRRFEVPLSIFPFQQIIWSILNVVKKKNLTRNLKKHPTLLMDKLSYDFLCGFFKNKSKNGFQI